MCPLIWVILWSGTLHVSGCGLSRWLRRPGHIRIMTETAHRMSPSRYFFIFAEKYTHYILYNLRTMGVRLKKDGSKEDQNTKNVLSSNPGCSFGISTLWWQRCRVLEDYLSVPFKWLLLLHVLLIIVFLPPHLSLSTEHNHKNNTIEGREWTSCTCLFKAH